MRELHVIGFTSDHGGLLLSAKRDAKTGSYVLSLDATVFDQIDTARLAQAGIDGTELQRPPRVQIESSLSPREIQARLRSGRSVAQVAAEAGVSTEWVDRFAAPVLAEQAAAAERAGKAYLNTTRRGISDRPLAAAVSRNLAARGVRTDEEELKDTWSAHHLGDGDWLVSLRFRSRGRALVAQWVYNAVHNTLISHNRLGTELGYVEKPRGAAGLVALPLLDGQQPPPAPTPRRRRRAARKPVPSAGRAAAGRAAAAKVSVITTAAAPRPDAKRSTAKRSTTKRSTAKRSRSATKRTSTARQATKPATGQTRPTAKRSGTTRPATKRAAPKRAATNQTARKQTATKRATTKRATTKRAPAKRPIAKGPAAKGSAATSRTSIAGRPATTSAVKRLSAKKAVRPSRTAAAKATRQRSSTAPPAAKRGARKA